MADTSVSVATVNALGERARHEARQAESLEDVARMRIAFLGRKNGELTNLLRSLGDVPTDVRREIGAAANLLKSELEAVFAEREVACRAPDALELATDPTMPGRSQWHGGVHPVTMVVDDICDIFREMGFTRAVGPEADTEYNNFEALNFPADHPALDDHDTFYLGQGRLLRTHTSPVQIRTMHGAVIGWAMSRCTFSRPSGSQGMRAAGKFCPHSLQYRARR